MSETAANRPAILGGVPVRPSGPPAWPRQDAGVHAAIQKIIESGDWGRYHGPNCPDLCGRLAQYHDMEHVLLSSSGTAAVELALRGAGVRDGDEVILAGYDFKANFQNVLCVGAVPVLVDISPTTWQLDPARIQGAMTSRTRAIIVSHLHGGAVDVREVQRIAVSNGITVIEDACQNPGAIQFGQRSGTWGDVGIMSFGGSKLLTAGRGGAILTRRSDVAERIKRYVLRGNDAYPMSEMQAAIVIPQLERLDEHNSRRRDAVVRLCEKLKCVVGLETLEPATSESDAAYYKLGLRYRPEDFDGLSRNLFADSMRAEGVAIDPGFRGLHLIHASRRFRAADALLEATRADAEMLTLHHPVLLEGDSAIEEIVAAIQKVRVAADDISKWDSGLSLTQKS